MNFVKILTGECNSIVENPPIIFPYECDHFQKHAFNAISKGENILATAHTGMGKTTIAEYAIANTVRLGKKAIYTSPIKSLSNEKYNDFITKFSNKLGISFGILTGDNKINPDADCLIMTAEILRNALYKLGNNENSALLDQIGCVIMDEVHFINDPDRGKVWEETIVLLDRNVQLILLSATINEPERFAEWIGTIKQKPINLIPTVRRAVPLQHYLYNGEEKLYLIYDQDGNYKYNNYSEANKEYQEILKLRDKKFKSQTNFNLIQDTIKFLQKKNLLQAIFFSFSKRNCEHYAQTVSEVLVNFEEISEINKIFDKYMNKYVDKYEKLEQYQTVRKLLNKGIAFHHSGLLPVLKEIIEIIFRKGLIKVLFATETFAVGVNMPTRTVIFTELEKHTSAGKRSLNTAEYKQMSGRAGRRGIDTIGNVIIIPVYNFPEDQLLRTLLTGSVPGITSQFQIDYQFFLKAIQSESTSIADFLNNSLYNTENHQIIKANQRDLMSLENRLNLFDFKDVKGMDKIIELYEYQNTLQELDGLKVTMSKNKKQKINNLKLEINRDDNLKKIYEKWGEYQKLKQQYEITRINVEKWKAYNDNTIIKIKSFLTETGFILDDTILKKGIIAAQINECNPIILTDMITKGYFKGLNPQEITGLLAIFIDETRQDDKIPFVNIASSYKLKSYIQDLTDLIEYYKNIEKKYGINNNDSYWDISFDFIDSAYNWADGKFVCGDIYIGNFIRSMIKINNIVKDLIFLCKIEGDNEIIPVLEKIEPLIMRDFVSINSLYLNTN